MNSNLGWHSEASADSENLGTMMINTHHKMNIDFDAQISKFGDQIMDIETNENTNGQLMYEDPEEVQKQNRINSQIQARKF
jgi:hypothetical protein